MEENSIKLILGMKKIAVVGLSDKPDRPSFDVAAYLQKHGYEIIPVNPMISEWNSLKAYPDLKSIPFDVDVVDVFRKSEDVPSVIDEAIEKKVKAVWLQLGVSSFEAEQKAKDAGLLVVSNKCMKIEHSLLNK